MSELMSGWNKKQTNLIDHYHFPDLHKKGQRRGEKMSYKKVESELNIWNPTEVGQAVEGTIVNMSEGKFGTNYELKEKNTDMVYTLPAHKQLLSTLGRIEDIKGKGIQIIFSGEKSSPNGNYKAYEVYVDE